jgi:hypothetical protein
MIAFQIEFEIHNMHMLNNNKLEEWLFSDSLLRE